MTLRLRARGTGARARCWSPAAPFAETKEWVGGFALLECRDREEAIEIAARHPMARGGSIAIRPF